MINIQNLTPGRPTHPGEILADELEAHDINQQDFASQIGMQKSQLNEIIKGKRNINAEIAVLLEKVLDVPAQYWMNAQQGYDLDMARQQKRVQEQAAAIELWKSVKNYISVKFLKAQKLISGDPVADIPIVKKIFGVSTIDELAALQSRVSYRFRKSEKAQTDELNLQTWIALVKYKASQQIVPPFDHESRPEVVESVRSIIAKNENVIYNIQVTLNKRGIKFVQQDKAEKVPVDGMTCWSEDSPAIAITLRHRRIDNLAFTLFHELGHVYLHLTSNNESCFVDLDIEKPVKNKEENEADTFARDCLISAPDWKRFNKTGDQFSPEYITRFANEIGIHPAVVAGRVCHDNGYYSWNRGSIESAIN